MIHGKKKLSSFFDMAKEILPSEFYIEFNSQNKIDQIIDEQLDRAQKIVENSESISLSVDSQQKLIAWVIPSKLRCIAVSAARDFIIGFHPVELVAIPHTTIPAQHGHSKRIVIIP